MATGKILFDLQDLDHRLGEATGRVAFIDRSLGSRPALVEREKGINERRVRLRDLEREQRDLEMTSQSTRERISTVEEKLYGGSVGNPRELQDLSRELGNLKTSLQTLDELVLENLMNVEESQNALLDDEGKLEKEERSWNRDQKGMAKEKVELQGKLDDLEFRRLEITEELDSLALEAYERVRRTKGGQGVARVEQGLCRSCGVTLPTHRVQRARMGQEAVHCDSCGRILFAG